MLAPPKLTMLPVLPLLLLTAPPIDFGVNRPTPGILVKAVLLLCAGVGVVERVAADCCSSGMAVSSDVMLPVGAMHEQK